MGSEKLIEEFDYMYENIICSTVRVYSSHVEVKDFEKDIVLLPFGLWSDNVSIEDVEELYEERCFPRNRFNCKQLLRDAEIDFYNPRAILLKTHGVMSDDLFWIRFSYERNLCWEDVRKILK